MGMDQGSCGEVFVRKVSMKLGHSSGSEGDDPTDRKGVTIRYNRTTPKALRRTMEDIESYQICAHAFTQDIRTEWPPESVRICFAENERPLTAFMAQWE